MSPDLEAKVRDLIDQRDRARRWAVALEQECARLTERVAFLESFVEPAVEEWDG